MNNLSKGLTKLGHEIVLGSFSFDRFPPDGVGSVRLNKLRNLPNYLDSKRIDIIHSQHTKMNYYSLLSSKPFIFHFHGTGSKLQEVNLRFSFILCKNRISKIIYTSSFSVQRTRKIVGNMALKIPYEVIYNGVDTSFYHSKVPRTYKVGDPQLLFVGNLYRHKNVARIVEEMPQILKSFPSLHLQIVGSGDDYGTVRDLVTKLKLEKNIELLGAITSEEELRIRYSSCDIYISASKLEDNPLPLLEAMACGKPVLVSDIPSHMEMVSRSNAGLIFSLDDKQGIERGITNILDQMNNLENNAKLFAKENDWSNVCKRVSRIYEQLVS
jgi:glycosyltransferase involved in cell wall biosynthesis